MMFPVFALALFPQGNPLFYLAFLPIGPAARTIACPATLGLSPEDDPEDDPEVTLLRPPSPARPNAAPAVAR